MRDRIALLYVLAMVSACVSSTADVPAVTDMPASGEAIYILASGERVHPYAAQGSWSAAAQLAADLEDAGFVPSVVLDAAAIPEGSAVVESIEHGGECFSHAFLAVLTVGVIPELGCREYGQRFRVRCPDGVTALDVDAHFEVRSYVGWLVWPLALSPNWVYDSEGPPTRRREEVLLLRQELRDALESERCAA